MEVINTIGAKEGLSHLMWTLVQPGDVALVPEPSYPIHIYAPIIAGAEIRKAPVGSEESYFDVVEGKTAALFRWAMYAGARAGGDSGSGLQRERRSREVHSLLAGRCCVDPRRGPIA